MSGEKGDTVVKRLGPGESMLGVDAIRRLKALDGDPVPSVVHLSEFLSRTDNVLLVAVVADGPVGYLVAYMLSRIDCAQKMMYLYEVDGAESHRRQGIGKELVRLLKSICRKEDVMKMWVQTERSNVAASGLYASTGAVPHVNGHEVTYSYSRESFIDSAM